MVLSSDERLNGSNWTYNARATFTYRRLMTSTLFTRRCQLGGTGLLGEDDRLLRLFFVGITTQLVQVHYSVFGGRLLYDAYELLHLFCNEANVFTRGYTRTLTWTTLLARPRSPRTRDPCAPTRL